MPSWHSAGQDPRIPKRHAPEGTEPHPLKRGVIAGRCYGCGFVAPRGIEDDPGQVHNVPAQCEHCDRPTEAYSTVHAECGQRAIVATRAFWQKYLGVKPPEDVEAAEPSERKSTGTGPGKPAHPRYAEVQKYLAAYGGANSFLQDMQAIAAGRSKWDRLTDRQTDAVCKFIDSERDRPAETGVDLTAFPVGRTLAAVDNDSGGVTFLVIDHVAQSHPKWGGWVFVKQQQGPNEVRLGSQRPRMTYTGQWPSLIQRVLADIDAAVRRYGQELGVCGVCGLQLTNDQSRREGIGPVCAAKLNKEEAA